MEILRTPEECFNNLEDYNFNENYITITIADNLSARMHYVDVNSDSDETILLLHGEPTWSYLYRKMIPILEKSGKRIIAPDLIGFGKSDKIKEKEEYTYERHVVWTSEIISQLGLKNITLFAQDWGGLIGLRMVANHPELFNGLVLSNTWLPIGKGSSEGFDAWKKYSQTVEKFNSGRIVYGGTVNKISDKAVEAYNAPFPGEDYLACARQFPTLVPMDPDAPSVPENIEAWKILKEFNKPTVTIFGTEDKVSAGGEKIFQKLIPGCEGMNHKLIHGGHFIQEDQPEELAEAIINLYK